ncbi:MAG: HD domain-containing protein, partial [Acidimicrobiaceae bacterium]
GGVLMDSVFKPNWQPTGLIQGAFEIASHEHRDCVRKGSSIPYISHLLAVSALVIEHGGSEVQAAAALLHDVLEDT